ncbi:DUF6478 family protein [Paracoccus sp. (in: a-proteobacteria)]|uniref:DUF6478 family protein n=1 Tax=Paracoccus sp. TaxID=267 RepID=UPI0032202ED8
MRPRKWLDRKTRESALRQWGDLAAAERAPGPVRLALLRDEALGLRAQLDRFLGRTDRHAALSGAALEALALPGGTDWRWRPGVMAAQLSPRGLAAPDSGTRLGDGAAVWHDCPEAALILDQIGNPGPTDLSPFGLRLEAFGFAGSFLSLSLDLPAAALHGLTRGHVLRLETELVAERALRLFARLNICHGPNVEEMTLQFDPPEPGRQCQRVLEFDLAYMQMQENRLERIWLDLILEAPRMNALEIRELFFSRHLRAQF